MEGIDRRLGAVLVACALACGCASERSDSEGSRVPVGASAGSAGDAIPDAPAESDNSSASPVGLPEPVIAEEGSVKFYAGISEPAEVMPAQVGAPETPLQTEVVPGFEEAPTATLPGQRPLASAIAAHPLEAPPLLTPDGVASTPATLRGFNPIRDGGTDLRDAPESGIKSGDSMSPGVSQRLMASPMGGLPLTPPMGSAGVMQPDAAFSAPSLSPAVGSVVKPSSAGATLPPVGELLPMTGEQAGTPLAVSSDSLRPQVITPEVPHSSVGEPALPSQPVPTTEPVPEGSGTGSWEPMDSTAASEPAGGNGGTEPANEASPKATVEADAPYTVVEVFYGTDRNSITTTTAKRSIPLGWGVAAGFVAALTSLLGLASLRFRNVASLRWTALGSLTCTVVFVGVAVAVSLQPRPSPDMEAGELVPASGVAYGNQRGVLEYGICKVTIPKTHKIGQLEAPSIFRLDFRETPERHVVLAGIEPLADEVFFRGLKARIDESSAGSAFVFVHGFNVTFEDAARRTAQIAYDLKFDGAPIFYSWPSQGGLFKYTIDETNVMWTVPHLRQFLTEVAERTQASRIHLVAHSMGNRALTSALRDLSFLPEDKRPRFNEVVLTAPDIDAEVFRKDIAPYIVQTADRVTLYASSNDTALAYSKTVHGYPRAGDSGQELLVLPGMETVDVSEVDTSLLGHSYYGSNETVLADLIEVLHRSMPPRERRWLRSAQAGPLEYWVFHR